MSIPTSGVAASTRERLLAPATLAPLAQLMNSGRYEQAESGAETLLGRHASAGALWKIYGAARLFQGKDALPALRQAVKLMPSDVESHFYLGNALHDSGDFEAAAASLRQTIQLNPLLAEAHGNLGNALQELGHFEEAAASYRRMLTLNPDVAEAHNSLGNALLALGRLEQAAASYRDALRLRPESVGALINLANALRDLGQSQEALQHCRRALELRPDFAEGQRTLGNIEFDLGQLDRAEKAYREAIALEPGYADAHAALGMLLRQMARAAEAEQSCREALRLSPGDAATIALLGEIEGSKGRFAEAERLFRQALEVDPDRPEAWTGIARYRKMSSADADWLIAVQRVLAKEPPLQHRLNLHYAIGKYFDDIGEFDDAFEHYRLANELSKRYAIRHDRERLIQRVDRLIASQDRRWLAAVTAASNPSRRPVFIVGLPRSGTSLAEQMLASHADVFGAGELRFWHAGLARYEAAVNCGQESDTVIASVAQDYMRTLAGFSRDALRVVDKMPANTMNLGLIHAAFPHARIIHMRRHPIDTCLSIYFQVFSATHTYAHDLEDLAHHYTQVSRLMRHWHATLPAGSILDVPYEQLVEDPQTWARRMVEFIGLPWDPRCLDFHATERPVLTASSWQVRQKINKSSAGRWHNYEKFVGPLKPLLALESDH